MPPAALYDCVRCGACCCNPDENRETGYTEYVEINPRSSLLKKEDLVRRLVFYNDDNVPHMRITAGQRCIALKGTLGRKVSCDIYPDRPQSCRKVQPGDSECKKRRRERGIDSAPAKGAR